MPGKGIWKECNKKVKCEGQIKRGETRHGKAKGDNTNNRKGERKEQMQQQRLKEGGKGDKKKEGKSEEGVDLEQQVAALGEQDTAKKKRLDHFIYTFIFAICLITRQKAIARRNMILTFGGHWLANIFRNF